MKVIYDQFGQGQREYTAFNARALSSLIQYCEPRSLIWKTISIEI